MTDAALIDVSSEIDSLVRFISSCDYAGYDPYDALNSPIVRLLTLGTKSGRIAWTQFLRRFPLNVRPLLLLPAGHNPKGIGLFLQGFARLHSLQPNGNNMEIISRLLNLLQELRSKSCSGNGWGYNFDWQSRAAFVKKGTPTIVNSSFIGHALLNTYEITKTDQALELALPIADFIIKDLHRKKEDCGFCFSYTPLDHNYVHNANLLGASLLIRIHAITGEQVLKETALNALAYTMHYQHDDGGWFYAEKNIQHWIDSFHTGFNLQAIRYFLDLKEATEHRDAYKKGVKYYAENFFLANGTPKYYHNRIYPIDIHAPAQAIAFFAETGSEYATLTDKILAWMLENMRNKKTGSFFFRKGKYITNKIPYIRWGQAWAFHALTEYAFSKEAK